MAAVSRRDEAEHLTPAECRLLMCLARSAGRIVGHRELMEVMSSGDRKVSIGNLRSSACRLRSKIELDPALSRVIITYHKLGYSLAGKEGVPWIPELERQMMGAGLGMWRLPLRHCHAATQREALTIVMGTIGFLSSFSRCLARRRLLGKDPLHPWPTTSIVIVILPLYHLAGLQSGLTTAQRY